MTPPQPRRAFGSRFFSAFLATLAFLPLAVSLRLYETGMDVHAHLRATRLYGLGEVAVLLFVAVAAAMALAIAIAPLHRLPERWRAAGRVGMLFVIFANLAAMGLALYHKHPQLAPWPWQLAAAAAALTVTGSLAFRAAEHQKLVLRALLGAMLALEALVMLPLPWVVHDAMTELKRYPCSITPPAHPAVKPDAPRRIVLVTFDAMRASSTTLARPSLDTTPELVKLAHESVAFTHCHSAGDQTVASMPVVLTGMRPSDIFSQVFNGMSFMREGAVTSVAGFLQAAGYHTTFATSLVSPQTFGVRGDFDEGMRNVPFLPSPYNTRAFLPLAQVATAFLPARMRPPGDVSTTPSRPGEHPAEQAVANALRYYMSDRDRVFVWVHLGVPHHPYLDIPASALGGPIDARRFPELIPEMAHATEADTERYTRVYENYVRYGDHVLGQFVERMKASGLWDDTMLVVTSDHGTSFTVGEHAIYALLRPLEAITHVPLVIHMPGQRAGRVESANVTHEDLVPTMLQAVYQKLPAGFKGSPIAPGALSPERIAYSWTMSTLWASHKYSPQQTVAAYYRDYKYELTVPNRHEALYDLAADPASAHDLTKAKPELTRRLRLWTWRNLIPQGAYSPRPDE